MYTLNVDKQNVLLINDQMEYVKDTLIPIALYGRSSSVDYGEYFQDNFYYILQNFYNNVEIARPVYGMLWYDTSQTPPMLKIYTDRDVWKRVMIGADSPGSVAVSPTGTIIIETELTAALTDIDTPVDSVECKWYQNESREPVATGTTYTPTVSDYYYAEYTYTDYYSAGKKVVARSADIQVRPINNTLGVATVTGGSTVGTELLVTVEDKDGIDVNSYSYKWFLTGQTTAIFASSTTARFTPAAPGSYYAVVSYKDSANTIVADSATSNVVDIADTATPNKIGDFWQGGYYFGRVLDGGKYYYLILAPVVSDDGQLGYKKSTSFQNTKDTLPVATITKVSGPSASKSLQDLSAANFPATNLCESLTINGYDDWYLPALHELELAYYMLKPTADKSVTATYTVNLDAYPPHSDYAIDPPKQTMLPLFKSGGTQALATANNYWTSTSKDIDVYTINMQTGEQITQAVASLASVRAIRRVEAGTAAASVDKEKPVIKAISATVDFNSTKNQIKLEITVPHGEIKSAAYNNKPIHGTATFDTNTLLYTPTTGWSGTDKFDYYVTNANGNSNTSSVTIVTKQESAIVDPAVPEIGPVTATIPINSSKVIHLDPNEDLSTSVKLNIINPHGTIKSSQAVEDGVDGSASFFKDILFYTPAVDWLGVAKFHYTASNNNGDSLPNTITITVEAPSEVPVLKSDPPTIGAVTAEVPFNAYSAGFTGPVTAFKGYPVKLNVIDRHGTLLGGGTNPDPEHGTITFEGDTAYYIPTPNWTGLDKFSYYLTNISGASTTNTIEIKTLPQAVNADPLKTLIPVVGDVTAVVEYNSVNNSIKLNIIGNGAATSASLLTAKWLTTSPPQHYADITFLDSTLVYSPEKDWSGEINFKYTVNDGNNDSNEGNIKITTKIAPPVTYDTGNFAWQLFQNKLHDPAPLSNAHWKGGAYAGKYKDTTTNQEFYLFTAPPTGTVYYASAVVTSTTKNSPACPIIRDGTAPTASDKPITTTSEWNGYPTSIELRNNTLTSIATKVYNSLKSYYDANMSNVGIERSAKIGSLLVQPNFKTWPFTDWWVPSINELEMLYFFLKPTALANKTSFGANANASPPRGNYTTKLPTNTKYLVYNAAAGVIGSYAILDTSNIKLPATLWSSTFNSDFTQAKVLNFADGSVSWANVTDKHDFRVVRREPVTPITLSGLPYYDSQTITITLTDPNTPVTETSYTLWNAASDGLTPIASSNKNQLTPPVPGNYYIVCTYKDKYGNLQGHASDVFKVLASKPLKVGDAWGGGVYAGILNDKPAAKKYYLVLSPRLQGEFTVAEPTLSSVTQSSTAKVYDGVLNTAALLKAKRAAANQVTRINSAVDVNGVAGINYYTDWYIPAKAELEVMYRLLKPTETPNAVSGVTQYGETPALSTAYTATNPAQTTVSNYFVRKTETDTSTTQALGTYEANRQVLGTSTWMASNTVSVQNMDTGLQEDRKVTTTTSMRYRVIRRVLVQ